MFKCWIALSILRINHTIQRISIRELNYTLLQIEIYPVDSVIQLLNNLNQDVWRPQANHSRPGYRLIFLEYPSMRFTVLLALIVCR